MDSAYPGHGSETSAVNRARSARRPVGARAAVALLVATGACGRIGFTLLDLPPADAGPDERHDAAPADAAAAPADARAVDVAADVADASDAAAATDAADAEVSDEDAEAGAPEAGPDSGEAGCAQSAIVNYCTALPFLPAPPMIDGVLDCGPQLLPIVPVGWSGPGVVPAGNSASVAVAWRPDGLYVFVAVTCPQLIIAGPGEYAWEGNGVELYVDSDGVFPSSPLYDDAGTEQLVTEAPDSSTSTSTTGEVWRNAVYEGPWTSTNFELYGTVTGYVLEAFIVASDLDLTTWSLASGGMVGFNLAINVAFASPTTTGNDGHRLGQFFMYVAPPPDGLPFSDVRSFCKPVLGP
jgi:hypothetical protein